MRGDFAPSHEYNIVASFVGGDEKEREREKEGLLPSFSLFEMSSFRDWNVLHCVRRVSCTVVRKKLFSISFVLIGNSVKQGELRNTCQTNFDF